MYRLNILLVILYCLIFLGCENKSLEPQEEDKPIIADGTYMSEDVDKDIWGDFQLVLELDKSNYLYKEAIHVKVYYKNIGTKSITLDGILPYRNSANPPRLIIRSIDKPIRFQINKILDSLLNNKKNIVEPATTLMLMQLDLTHVSGFIHYEDTDGMIYLTEEFDNIYSKFEKGAYSIFADFWPTPQVYYSNTDTLQFTIK